MRKIRLQMQQEDEINKMQGPKMNANSRRILERKQRGETADDTTSRKTENLKKEQARRIERITVTSTANQRKTTKSVPTGAVDLTKHEDASSFEPRINRRSVALAAKKREGKVEDHLLRQAELAKKKKADKLEK